MYKDPFEDSDFKLNWLRDRGQAPKPKPNARIVTHHSFYHMQDAHPSLKEKIGEMVDDSNLWSLLKKGDGAGFVGHLENEYGIQDGCNESLYSIYLLGGIANHIIHAERGLPIFVFSFEMPKADAQYFEPMRVGCHLEEDEKLFAAAVKNILSSDSYISLEDIPFFTSRNGELKDKEQIERFTKIADEKGATQFEVAGSYAECVCGTREWLRSDWKDENYMRAYTADPLIFEKPEEVRRRHRY